MENLKQTGRIVGILFLTLMIAYTVGTLLIDPILNSPAYLTEAHENKSLLITGVLLELMNGVAYIGIAVLVYPVFKKTNESLALLYLGIRLIEFAMQMLSDMSPLLLIAASQDVIPATYHGTGDVHVLGSVLLGLRFWSNQMVFISYGLSAMIFYYLVYRLKLIPRFLSIWGLIGAPLVLVNVLLDSFTVAHGIDLGLFMGLNEIVLGSWLIVKGFKAVSVNRNI